MISELFAGLLFAALHRALVSGRIRRVPLLHGAEGNGPAGSAERDRGSGV